MANDYWEQVEEFRHTIKRGDNAEIDKIRAIANDKSMSPIKQQTAAFVVEEYERIQSQEARKWDGVRSWIAIGISTIALIVSGLIGLFSILG